MERILTYTITKEHASEVLFDFLKKHLRFSSQNITALKKMPESIFVNNKWEYTNYRLKENDVLKLHIRETESSKNILPVALPLFIIYEDDDILVVNKPAFMPIHPSQNNYENTLANAVAYYFKSQNIPYVFRCINRLDRDTTGLTVLAKHMYSASLLSDAVKTRTLKREYLAICDGQLATKKGLIDSPIGRKDGSTIERCIDFENGEHALTHYEVLRENLDASLLLLHLETGRTHQIRVHLTSIGHPLLGDFLYNESDTRMNRQALHSYRLQFLHPITKEPLCFEAPLPPDMGAFFP